MVKTFTKETLEKEVDLAIHVLKVPKKQEHRMVITDYLMLKFDTLIELPVLNNILDEKLEG